MGIGKTFTDVGISLLTGAGVGAALMYLFDPEQGNRRRDSLTKSAADLLGETQETVGDRLGGFAQTARQVVRSAIPDLGAAAGWLKSSGHAAGDYVSNSASEAAKYASDARDAGVGYVQTAYGRAGEALHLSGNSRKNNGSASAATSVAVTTAEIVAAAAIGAGVMYLLDPEKGAIRRQTLVNQLTGLFTGATHSAERTARHYADVARDTVDQVKEHFTGSEVEGDVTAAPESGDAQVTGVTDAPDQAEPR